MRTTSQRAARSSAVLAPVGLLPLADVLESVPARAVVLDGDPQLGQQDVGPHLEVREERPAHADGVESLGHAQPREQVGAQSRFDGGCRPRGALAHERLSDGERGVFPHSGGAVRRRAVGAVPHRAAPSAVPAPPP